MGNQSSTLKNDYKKALLRFNRGKVALVRSIFKNLTEHSTTPGKTVDKTTFLKYFPLPGMMGERLFSVFDRDNSGAIDFQEFLTGMGLIYRGTVEEKKRFLFEMYDLDDDGVVTRAELFTMLSHIPSAFKILDASMEGRGQTAELREDPQTQSRIRNIVDVAFKNKSEDENLTFVEFTRVVNKTPEILEIINVFYDEALPEHDFACRTSKITDGPLPRLSIWSTAPGLLRGGSDRGDNGYNLAHAPRTKSADESPGQAQSPTSRAAGVVQKMSGIIQRRISGTGSTSREENDTPRARSEYGGDYTPSSSLSSALAPNSFTPEGGMYQEQVCPMCHTQVNLQHCLKCGTLLNTNILGKELACDECGWEIETVRFCFRCGQPLKRMLCQPGSQQATITTAGHNSPPTIQLETYSVAGAASTSSSEIPSNISTPLMSTIARDDSLQAMMPLPQPLRAVASSPAAISPQANISFKNCIICGEMNKVGRNIKIIRTRYFVLRDRFLHYYRSKADAAPTESGGGPIPKGVIFLEGAYIRAIPDSSTALEIKNLSTNRIYHCKNTEDRDRWVEALAKASKTCYQILDYYDIKQSELGRGKFAVVYEATRKDDGIDVAVKVISKKDLSEESREFIRTEIAILKMVHHENLVTMVDMFDETDCLYLVMQKINGGDLLRRLLSLKNNHVSENTAQTIVVDLVNAVRFLHEHGITHRDLKPENVLIVDPPGETDLSNITHVKVTDFGLSAISPHPMDAPLGTVAYAAPEILKNQSYSQQVDMWSLGAITFIVLGGELPFRGKTKKEIAVATMKVEYSYNHSPVWKEISSEAKNFVDSLLRLKPSERMTAFQVTNHPWLANRIT